MPIRYLHQPATTTLEEMRVLVTGAVSASAVAAGLYLVYKRVHSRAGHERERKHKHDANNANVEARENEKRVHDKKCDQPDNHAMGVSDGLTVLPESAESFVDGISGRSPLRKVFAHALTRRVLGAVPLYAVTVFLWGGINAKGGRASSTAAYVRQCIVSFGFHSTLWPTDKGVRSRSYFRIMVPLNLLRAVLVTRAVAIEVAISRTFCFSRLLTPSHPVSRLLTPSHAFSPRLAPSHSVSQLANMPAYGSHVATAAHYTATLCIVTTPWANFVLDVRNGRHAISHPT